ncbi:hypothetical protein ACM66B_003384 [Microbotryomycetes sp. NB124-2]
MALMAVDDDAPFQRVLSSAKARALKDEARARKQAEQVAAQKAAGSHTLKESKRSRSRSSTPLSQRNSPLIGSPIKIARRASESHHGLRAFTADSSQPTDEHTAMTQD